MELVKSDVNGYYCPQDPGEPNWNAPRLSINDTEARFLKELFRGRVVLEIGTGLGVSTNAIASVADWVYTVDIDDWVKENVAPNLPRNTTFHMNYNSIPECEAAFVDGYHEYEQCRKDIQTCKRLVSKGGLMVFHDLAMGAVRQALVDEGYNNALQVLTHAGIGVCWNE
jgi:hypothetical protein